MFIFLKGCLTKSQLLQISNSNIKLKAERLKSLSLLRNFFRQLAGTHHSRSRLPKTFNMLKIQRRSEKGALFTTKQVSRDACVVASSRTKSRTFFWLPLDPQHAENPRQPAATTTGASKSPTKKPRKWDSPLIGPLY